MWGLTTTNKDLCPKFPPLHDIQATIDPLIYLVGCTFLPLCGDPKFGVQVFGKTRSAILIRIQRVPGFEKGGMMLSVLCLPQG